jgi:hypothetical protein
MRPSKSHVAALAGLILSACVTTTTEPQPVATETELRPTALRLNLTGKSEAVFGAVTAIPVLLTRDGTEEPVATELTPGGLTRMELPPGDYSISRIGPMACYGIGFTVAPGAEPRALGTLQAEILRTQYDIALLDGSPASTADLAELGAGAQAAPLYIDRNALCHVGRNGPGTEFRDLSPAEQVMAAILFGGLCAAAVASGGFCAF